MITDINDSDLTDCADIVISDDAADTFIAADDGNYTYCVDTNVSDDDVDGLIMLMG